MLKVLCDAYVAADAGNVALLGLLDLSAAFDTVDHWILIERLRRTFGVVGHPFDWVISYLTGRTQFVQFKGTTSGITSVSCGVPQGSVLGPTLFVLYAVTRLTLFRSLRHAALLCMLMLMICRSTAMWTPHSLPYFWRGWPTALHVWKGGRQAIGFASTHRRPSSYGWARLDVGSCAQQTS